MMSRVHNMELPTQHTWNVSRGYDYMQAMRNCVDWEVDWALTSYEDFPDIRPHYHVSQRMSSADVEERLDIPDSRLDSQLRNRTT